MRRKGCRSIFRQRLYTAILAEHSQRDEFFRHEREREDAMEAMTSVDPRDPIDIARAASVALRGGEA